MKHLPELLTVTALVALPLTATAQSTRLSDQAYCTALSDTYTRYIGYDEFDPDRLRRRGSLSADLAVVECKQGNTAAAIPVLEKMLSGKKFTLPSRG
jgi:hypothetical protein